MAALAGEALAGAKRIADLFCGAGAFALRLGAGSRRAGDRFRRGGDRRAECGAAAARQALSASRAKRATCSSRPLSADELERFDGVLFDPPRAGALAQAKELAKSGVPVVVAISCNAETFARDARVLVDGGYEIEPRDAA